MPAAGGSVEVQLPGGGRATVGSATKMGIADLGRPGYPARFTLRYGSLRLARTGGPTPPPMHVETPSAARGRAMAGVTRTRETAAMVTPRRTVGLTRSGNIPRFTVQRITPMTTTRVVMPITAVRVTVQRVVPAAATGRIAVQQLSPAAR